MEKGTISGRAVFDESNSERLIMQARQLVCDVWAALGEPARRFTKRGGAEYLFTERLGVELRVSPQEDGEVRLDVQILTSGQLMSIQDWLGSLWKLGGRWTQWCEEGDELRAFHLTRTVSGQEFGPIRESQLRADLSQIKSWSDALCPLTAAVLDEEVQRAKYHRHKELLEYVSKWHVRTAGAESLHAWAEGVAEMVMGGVCVGITAEAPLEQSVALGLVATALAAHNGQTLGRCNKMSMGTEQVLGAVAGAPGVVALHARLLRMSANRYETANESGNLLSALASENRAVVFYGSYAELQATFASGQGAVPDPLRPAVCRFPGAGLEELTAFAVNDHCRRLAIRDPAFQRDVRDEVGEALRQTGRGIALRLVQQTVQRVIEGRVNPGTPADAKSFARNLAGCSETFGGIAKRARVQRPDAIQQHLQKRLTDPGLIPFLKSRLLGQDQAIEEQVGKLVLQVLTCPVHQPLRVGAVGASGTGKSEMASLLAAWLDMPFMNIDCASMPDHHTALAQLLGSGRGIIDSDQAGRLEQLAKNFNGAVVEISDADHAAPSVRGPITDVFLQMLETGEAQSAKGHMFPCSSLLCIFTLNLPNRKDESIFQPVGFSQAPSIHEVRKDAHRELTKLFSAAFWARVGSPILFGPLDDGVRAEIVRRALQDAAATALERMGLGAVCVEAPTEAARRLLSIPGAPGSSMGARGLLELGRQTAASAVMAFVSGGGGSGALEITLNENNIPILRKTA